MLRFGRVCMSAVLIAGTCVVRPVSAQSKPPHSVSAGKPAVVTLDALIPHQIVGGFRAECVYTGDKNKPVGARFRHLATGFVFDYLQIESVPQAFVWVNTPATSDKGEPHTQEHLLLGKGNRGRAVASAETLSLSDSSAYTMPWRTCYFFNTTAGVGAFYDQLQMRLDALLHPNYTDEEVRREVRNFGVTENADKTLRLEEKGSVYNEMVSTMDKSGSQLYRALFQSVYGTHHPLAFEAGGTPEALRTLTPAEIKTFRDRAYRLRNMGMVAAFPQSLSLNAVLARVGGILQKGEPDQTPPRLAASTRPTFPAPQSASTTDPHIVSFPDKNAEQPGEVGFAWPANRHLSLDEFLLLGFFLDTFASEPDTPLYKRFVDAKTRTLDTGATGVYNWTPSEQGFPVYVGISNVKPSFLTEANVAEMRVAVREELQKIVAYKDGSPELAAFNARLLTRLAAFKREQSKFVNSPPGFGARGTSSAWMERCLLLEDVPGFRKSVLLAPQMARVEKQLTGTTNLWRVLLSKWQIAGVTPYAVAARPDTALLARQQTERSERIATEVARLQRVYQTTNEQKTIRRYQADYEAETARQNAIAAHAKQSAHFVSNPPLVSDPSLRYKQTHVGSIPLFAATFDTMASATVRLSLPVNDTPQSELVYLCALPTLLNGAGVVVDGKPLSYEETRQKQRNEILSVGCGFSSNPDTGHYELVVTGSGNNPQETKRAVWWMKTLLTTPNWSRENLPRLRDVVDQRLQAERNRMLEQEEFWVSGVRAAWRNQDKPLALTLGSFLTQTHHLHRLRWMLQTAPTPEDGNAFLSFLEMLRQSGQSASRTDLEALTAALSGTNPSTVVPPAFAAVTAAFDALPSGAKPLAKSAVNDLSRTLGDLADATLAADWQYLCRQIHADFVQGPDETLRRINALRSRLLRTQGARLLIVGASSTQAVLAPDLVNLSSLLKSGTAAIVSPIAAEPLVTKRLQQRSPGANPVFVGLLAPSMKGGTVMNESRGTAYTATDDEALLRLLAANLYGGGGADSVFMKTWGAGLAYGNGIGSDTRAGRVSYYADHTPELPQTVRFVIDAVKASPRDPALVEYALANMFSSREAGGYEGRAFAQEGDLADGITPAKTKAFRTRLLALRTRPNLTAEVYDRLTAVMSAILPGYNGPQPPDPDSRCVVIGPPKQLDAYEAYLKNAVSPDTVLYRLYPRDFWLVASHADEK